MPFYAILIAPPHFDPVLATAAGMGFFGWFLLIWAAVSVIATPLVARLVAHRLDDADDAADLGHTAHD